LKLALLSVPTDSRNALGRSDVMYQPLCLPAVALANAVLAGAVELKRKLHELKDAVSKAARKYTKAMEAIVA
jgi:hypothetical protein